MRAFGNEGVAVLVGLIQVERVELVFQTQWRTGIFVPAKGLLLKSSGMRSQCSSAIRIRRRTT